jgi:hypothetical protein
MPLDLPLPFYFTILMGTNLVILSHNITSQNFNDTFALMAAILLFKSEPISGFLVKTKEEEQNSSP